MTQPNRYERVLRVVARHFLHTNHVRLEFHGEPEDTATIPEVIAWWPANDDARELLRKFDEQRDHSGTLRDVISAIEIAAEDCGYSSVHKGNSWIVFADEEEGLTPDDEDLG